MIKREKERKKKKIHGGRAVLKDYNTLLII